MKARHVTGGGKKAVEAVAEERAVAAGLERAKIEAGPQPGP